jgi:hypothetical protein
MSNRRYLEDYKGNLLSSKLDKFLDEIDPKNNYDKHQEKVNNVLNYHISTRVNNRVNSEDELKECLWFFVEDTYFWAGILTPEQHRKAGYGKLWYSKSIKFLEDAFSDDQSYQHIPHKDRDSSSDAEKIVSEMMFYGINGGVYKVLKELAKAIIADFANEDIGEAVDKFVGPLSREERLEICEEYISKYAYLLSESFIENPPSNIGSLLPQILKEHPRSILRMSEIG